MGLNINDRNRNRGAVARATDTGCLTAYVLGMASE